MREQIIRILFRLLFLNVRKSFQRDRGLLIIQFDGVSHQLLSEAIRKGYCPYIKRLIKKKRYELHAYLAEVPAMTNAVLAGLLYGVYDEIPGYTWYDRTLQMIVRAEHADSAKEVEKRLSQKGKPLLTGGSAIFSPYNAGATMTSYTAPEAQFGSPLRFILHIRMALLYFFHPFKALRIWISLFVNITIGLYRAAKERSLSQYQETLLVMLERMGFGELVRFATEMDMRRNTPILFVNNALYDEMAHAFGKRAPLSFGALRSMDWFVESIMQKGRDKRHLYDAIVYADHGQDDAVRFDDVIGKSFVVFLKELLPKEITVGFYIVQSPDPHIVENDIFCIPSGGYVHLYWKDSLSHPLTKETLRKRYPDFLKKIITNPFISAVLVRRKDGKHELIGKDGSILFDHGIVKKIYGKPFGTFNLDKEILISFGRYTTIPHLGDVVLFGNIDEKGRHIGFEKQQSIHGGFFGDQMHPFILTNNKALLTCLKTNKTGKNLFTAVRALREVV